MSTFSKFLRRFAGEYRSIGGALLNIAAGVALPPREKEEVVNAVGAIMAAADNIEASLKTLKEAGAPSASQVKAAVKEALPDLLPDLLAGLVEAELRKRLDADKEPAA
jgi:hypothetical protein